MNHLQPSEPSQWDGPHTIVQLEPDQPGHGLYWNHHRRLTVVSGIGKNREGRRMYHISVSQWCAPNAYPQRPVRATDAQVCWVLEHFRMPINYDELNPHPERDIGRNFFAFAPVS